MEHRELEKIFVDFIQNNKGYGKATIIYEAKLKSINESNSSPWRADILIIDSENDEYLALVEIKASKQKKDLINELRKIERYLKEIGKEDLPFFIVSSENEGDFNIHILSEDKVKEVSKDDFPSFEVLEAKVRADAKI
ncbi:MAG: hypothetical protein F9K23_10045 [Bacteroidetes bacterium]|nr:MAG: hypothetical protein F9K23_10045 [Bacteroidota bacterium]